MPSPGPSSGSADPLGRAGLDLRIGPADVGLLATIRPRRFEKRHIGYGERRVQRGRRVQRAGVIMQNQRPFGLGSTARLEQIQPVALSARILLAHTKNEMAGQPRQAGG
jgi:hypothetical protein